MKKRKPNEWLTRKNSKKARQRKIIPTQKLQTPRKIPIRKRHQLMITRLCTRLNWNQLLSKDPKTLRGNSDVSEYWLWSWRRFFSYSRSHSRCFWCCSVSTRKDLCCRVGRCSNLHGDSTSRGVTFTTIYPIPRGAPTSTPFIASDELTSLRYLWNTYSLFLFNDVRKRAILPRFSRWKTSLLNWSPSVKESRYQLQVLLDCFREEILYTRSSSTVWKTPPSFWPMFNTA